jgi:hypothetical protein
MRINIETIEVGGRSFTVGDRWPGALRATDENGKAKKIPYPAEVGAIFFVPTTTDSESSVEDAEQTEEEVKLGLKPKKLTVTDSTQKPGHYEVWAFPDVDSVVHQAGETRVLRIPREFAIVEETWPLEVAKKFVKGRRAETEVPDEPDEDEDDGEDASPVAAVAAPPS